LAKEIKLTMIQ